MDDRGERAHALKVRWMARMSWPVLVAGVMLVLGPAQASGLGKGIVIASMLGVVAGLNVPSLEVLRRAAREGAPRNIVMVLGFALSLRLGAAVVLSALLW